MNIIAQTTDGPVYETRAGAAGAIVRVAPRQAGLPSRLVTEAWVAWVLAIVAASTTPCHVHSATAFFAWLAVRRFGPDFEGVDEIGAAFDALLDA